MKQIEYDAKLGRIWPDAEIEEAVDSFFKSDEDLIVVGNELFIYFARAYSARNRKELELIFGHTNCVVNEQGRCNTIWQMGFCDHFDRALELLLGLQVGGKDGRIN